MLVDELPIESRDKRAAGDVKEVNVAGRLNGELETKRNESPNERTAKP